MKSLKHGDKVTIGSDDYNDDDDDDDEGVRPAARQRGG